LSGYCINVNSVASSIFAGQSNTLNGGVDNVIAAGTNHTICNSNVSIIAGGTGNVISGAGNAFISGAYNCICGGNAVSVWGQFNSSGGSSFSATLGQYLTGSSYYTTVEEWLKLGGSFAIPHPDPTKKKYSTLWHSFVESPTEGDNIYRYKICAQNCSASLSLPEYYKYLNKNDQVLVTPTNHFGTAFGVVDNTQSCVNFTTNQDGEYDVLIIGTRKDYDATKHFNGVESYGKVININ
jgi:hypothetical protein